MLMTIQTLGHTTWVKVPPGPGSHRTTFRTSRTTLALPLYIMMRMVSNDTTSWAGKKVKTNSTPITTRFSSTSTMHRPNGSLARTCSQLVVMRHRPHVHMLGAEFLLSRGLPMKMSAGPAAFTTMTYPQTRGLTLETSQSPTTHLSVSFTPTPTTWIGCGAHRLMAFRPDVKSAFLMRSISSLSTSEHTCFRGYIK